MSQYAKLAPHYRGISQQKKTYIDAVDTLILSQVPHQVSSVLDVGAADGVRGLSLARAMKAGHLTLCEPCPEMAALCRGNAASFPGAKILECDALALETITEQYDVILCLWNVLGHVPDNATRKRVLNVLRERLSPSGLIFMDVNNRHNAAAYGTLKVWGRRCLDAVTFNETRGNAVFNVLVGGENIPAKGHLFTPGEMDALIAGSGLVIRQRKTVHYLSGAISINPYQGQLFYILEAL
jgi:2-polyprenyl-3-methyl-5-hydroxy-6-metoxy-1,4-benzoquinol methylase